MFGYPSPSVIHTSHVAHSNKKNKVSQGRQQCISLSSCERKEKHNLDLNLTQLRDLRKEIDSSQRMRHTDEANEVEFSGMQISRNED